MATAKKQNLANKISSDPKFPYTTKPASLRRLLKEIPTKPRPPKFDQSLIKSWGFADNNDMTMLRVLKAVDFLNDRNEPTEKYTAFMNVGEGGKALGPEVRRVYAPFFQASHAPYNESNERLKNLFNIHSGGSNSTIENQIQTFKALCENAIFEGEIINHSTANRAGDSTHLTSDNTNGTTNSAPTAVHINLHIHLPENKTRREYEDIIEDIGRYIFGRTQ